MSDQGVLPGVQGVVLPRVRGLRRRVSTSLEFKETNVERCSNGLLRKTQRAYKLSPDKEKHLQGRLRRMQHDRPRASPAESAIIHRGWHASRVRIRSSLVRIGVPAARLARWDSCGSVAWVERDTHTGRVRLRCTRCKDRFCRTCSMRKRHQQIGRLLSLAESTPDRLRFLTLTLRHTQTPLPDQIDRLYECFRRLRQRAAWQEHVDAGVAVCEIKLGKDGMWHVHLHCLIAGKYWSQREISAQWLAVTGDSAIVDIRALPTVRAVAYVTKYVGKTVPSEVVHDDRLLDASVSALRSRRMVIVFGAWVGKLDDDSADERADEEWVGVDFLDRIAQRACAGSEYDIRILARLGLRPLDRFPWAASLEDRAPSG